MKSQPASSNNADAPDKPPYHEFGGGCQKTIYQIRWFFLAKIFHARLSPKWMVRCHGIPGMEHLPFITVGEVLLTAPLVALVVAGSNATFVDPSVSGSGFIAMYAMLLTFVYAMKWSSVVSFLFGVSWERLVPLHKLGSVISIVLSCFHGYVSFKYGGDEANKDAEPSDLDLDSQYSLLGPDTDIWKYLWDGSTNWSGSMITVCMVTLVALSAPRLFRRLNFDLWLTSHIILSLGLCVFAILHAAGMFIIVLWWMIDWGLRYTVGAGIRNTHRATLTKLMPDLVEIRIPKGPKFRFEAGQYVLLSVPEVGWMKFHPMTISSAPHEDEITVHIRVVGAWTRKLLALVDSQKEATDSVQVDVVMEGPFGNLSMDLKDQERYLHVLLVCGGIGATPIVSLARQLVYSGRSTVQVCWAVKDLELVSKLPILLSTPVTDEESPSGASQDGKTLSGTMFQADIYVTGTSNVMSPEAGAITGRGTTVEMGRPDVDAIVAQFADKVKAAAETDDSSKKKRISRVAVIACGPDALVESVKIACVQHSSHALLGQPCGSSNGAHHVRFDFHDEIFDY